MRRNALLLLLLATGGCAWQDTTSAPCPIVDLDDGWRAQSIAISGVADLVIHLVPIPAGSAPREERVMALVMGTNTIKCVYRFVEHAWPGRDGGSAAWCPKERP